MQKCFFTKHFCLAPKQHFFECTDISVSANTLQVFDRLGIKENNFKQGPFLWEEEHSNGFGQSKIRSLNVVNESGERSVKLMLNYHGLVMVDEEQRQYLLQCVENHRKIYPDCKKGNVKKNNFWSVNEKKKKNK